jgi:hypothetical protein
MELSIVAIQGNTLIFTTHPNNVNVLVEFFITYHNQIAATPTPAPLAPPVPRLLHVESVNNTTMEQEDNNNNVIKNKTNKKRNWIKRFLDLE